MLCWTCFACMLWLSTLNFLLLYICLLVLFTLLGRCLIFLFNLFYILILKLALRHFYFHFYLLVVWLNNTIMLSGDVIRGCSDTVRTGVLVLFCSIISEWWGDQSVTSFPVSVLKVRALMCVLHTLPVASLKAIVILILYVPTLPIRCWVCVDNQIWVLG